MAFSISTTLDILASYGIHPLEDDAGDIDLPGIGIIDDDETVYSISLDEVLGRGLAPDNDFPEYMELRPPIFDTGDQRLWDWWEDIQEIKRSGQGACGMTRRGPPRADPPEPTCAWYCPIHFFGHGWGIYIREAHVLSHARDIAAFVDWTSVQAPDREIARQLLRSAFYVFFLHEQFHHKVESLGFRLLVSSGTDRYRPYKRAVYQRTFDTDECLEEALANAESYRRLNEPRYSGRLDPAILHGLRSFLKETIPLHPPGYRMGSEFLREKPYRDGLLMLQSQVKDGTSRPQTPSIDWSVAPNMITALANIDEEIYVVLPKGADPIFATQCIDPRVSVSSRKLGSALTRHYGYSIVPGGKGSHVKLAKPGSPTIILPGNRSTLSPGVVKHALESIGGYPISRLPDLLEGRLVANA